MRCGSSPATLDPPSSSASSCSSPALHACLQAGLENPVLKQSQNMGPQQPLKGPGLWLVALQRSRNNTSTAVCCTGVLQSSECAQQVSNAPTGPGPSIITSWIIQTHVEGNGQNGQNGPNSPRMPPLRGVNEGCQAQVRVLPAWCQHLHAIVRTVCVTHKVRLICHRSEPVVFVRTGRARQCVWN